MLKMNEGKYRVTRFARDNKKKMLLSNSLNLEMSYTLPFLPLTTYYLLPSFIQSRKRSE